MPHVVTNKCVGCKFTDCVVVCPVACFYELEAQLVIHPEECIDCMACVDVCPVHAIYAAIILVVAVVAGQIILDAIGIHLHSLKVAGGIILFLFGLQMLFGRMDAKAGAPEPGRDLAVFPLAVPSIAGPGAMMAVIVLTDDDVYTVAEQAQTGVVLLVVLLLTYILLLFSDAILRIIGRSGAAILVRVMGIILCSLAVEIALTTLGVASWAPVRP